MNDFAKSNMKGAQAAQRLMQLQVSVKQTPFNMCNRMQCAFNAGSMYSKMEDKTIKKTIRR